MAPKKNAAAAAATAIPETSAPVKSTGNKSANWDEVFHNIYQYYMKETPQRTKLIDVFLAFLVIVGGLQFAYCVLAGNYV